MSTITREFTKEQLQQIIETDHVQCGEASALARIALASLEAEAYGYVHKAAYEQAGSCGLSSDHEAYRDSPTHIAVYTAPPAPVALTSGYSDFEEIWSSSTHPLTQDDEMKDFAWDIWNACRAAMLQGAEPVTTDYKLPFEQWLSQQSGTIDVECGCVMTEVFFHWLRVAYEAGKSPVIPDGWVILPDDPTQAMMNAWLSEVANWRGHASGYRAMIAAAPKLEA